jgi:type IV secretory pathway VirB4 component
MPEPTLPTQQFVQVKDIKDGIVYLKPSGLRQILIVSGVNFDLKSEMEQELILNTFQNFLNALDFPVQFFVHSRKVNVDSYIERMRAREAEETNQLLKIQIAEYAAFIKSFVDENAIISKTFFVIVPYDGASLEKAATGFLGALFPSKKKPKKPGEDVGLQESLRQLSQRVTEVTDGLSQIGLRAVPLRDEELVELFYNLYNPQLTEKKKLDIARQK